VPGSKLKALPIWRPVSDIYFLAGPPTAGSDWPIAMASAAYHSMNYQHDA
jgi:hypothetical protein